MLLNLSYFVILQLDNIRPKIQAISCVKKQLEWNVSIYYYHHLSRVNLNVKHMN